MDKDDFYGETIDRCVSDLVIKAGTGITLGGLYSILFKRGSWPITLGAGIGIGMAYTACEHRFQSPYINRVAAINCTNSFKETSKNESTTDDNNKNIKTDSSS